MRCRGGRNSLSTILDSSHVRSRGNDSMADDTRYQRKCIYDSNAYAETFWGKSIDLAVIR